MVLKGIAGLLLVRICIAVCAVVGAGIIGADVGALCAAALVPRWFCFIIEAIRGKQLFNNTAIDAMGFFDFVANQVIAAAGKHPDSETSGDVCQFVCQLDFEIAAAIEDFQAMRLFKLGKIADDFAVLDNEAEVTAFNESSEFGGQLFKGTDVKIAVADA